MKHIAKIEDAIDRLATGGLIIVRDDEGRENEGDLVGAAAHATAEMINTMVTKGRGLVCQPISPEIAERLDLPPQVARNTESHGTAFTVSVDAAAGITTGISAHDRAQTARVIADPAAKPTDLVRPGHMFPLVARREGVFARTGHTEASVDLVRLAGLQESALICEILSKDGSMARGAELERLAALWEMPIVSVAEIVAYRRSIGDYTITESTAARLPTEFGEFLITVFATNDPANREAVLLEAVQAESGHQVDAAGARYEASGGTHNTNTPRPSDTPHLADAPAPLVRVHSECLTGEALHSTRCECGPQLDTALQRIAAEGGALVYLRQEGRGIGLFEKIRAYTLQDEGLDTLDANLALGHPADGREYHLAARVLRSRGYHRIRLLSNNPKKGNDLALSGIAIDEHVPLHVGHSPTNARYLATKFERMGHIAPQPTHKAKEKSCTR